MEIPAQRISEKRPVQPGRLVKLVLVTTKGEMLGSLTPFRVASQWWQEARDIVRGAWENHGVKVTILRLLEADRPSPHGGSVTYLAEVQTRVPAKLWNGQLDEHTLRRSWARPGGPSADLAWADEVIAEQGLSRGDAAEQVRTWNLSSIWRVPTKGDSLWLKAVPPLFAHEGALLEKLQGKPVPRLLAHSGGRLLLAHIPGEDLHEAPLPTLLRMVTQLVSIQKEWISRTEELLAVGVPDQRLVSLPPALHQTIERNARQLSATDRTTLATFVEGLDDRFAEIQHCDISDTVVHGDFHPGNFRGDATSLVLMDWGDSCVGNPLLDEASFLERVPEDDRAVVEQHWHREWHDSLPSSDPNRASQLLAPVAAARLATVYQHFLDDIEPSERPYHAADPARWLQRTATLARSET